MDQSSEDNEIEFVEVKTPASKGKGNEKIVGRKKLVRRVGERYDSWLEGYEEEEKKRTKRTPGRKFDDSDADEVQVKKTKKTPVRKVSSSEEVEVVVTKQKKAPARKAPNREEEEEEEEEETVLLKTKSKMKKTPPKKVDSDEALDEPVGAEDEEELVKSMRGAKASFTAATKGRSRPKGISVSGEAEGKSEIDLPSLPKARSKAKGKEVEKSTKRREPRPIAKTPTKARVVEQITEPEHEAEEEDSELLPKKSAKKDGKTTGTATSSAKKANIPVLLHRVPKKQTRTALWHPMFLPEKLPSVSCLF